MQPPLPPFLWVPGLAASETDVQVAFRASFTLAAPAEVEVQLLGASWFVAWCDARYLTDGPARFPRSRPEYQSVRVTLPAGKHVLAIQVHHFGVPTRLLDNPPPFVWARMLRGAQVLPLDWKCSPIGGYTRTGRRINAQLGWMEWCDTRQVPDWQAVAHDDRHWAAPQPVTLPLGTPTPLSTANVRTIPHRLKPQKQGTLIERFGYEFDNPQARFFLRDLAPGRLPAQGVWRRYDLGRVRLARPRFVLELPAGSVVEFAQAESLTDGRVSPWITLSASDSSSLDHFVARGGRQEFLPLQPKGGRYLEVHVLAPPESVRFVEEGVWERTYYDTPAGTLNTGDKLLDRIWQVGVETHRACAEDALTDNPTRERGQWTGDVVSVGLDVAAVAFSDLRLFRRGLVQCALSARSDGLISGMCPGQDIFLATYSAQWVSACLRYVELTGDRSLLTELFPAAERNVAAFEAHRGPAGIRDTIGGSFVDWGYVRNPGDADMGLNLHYRAALLALVRWCTLVNKPERAAHYQALAQRQTALLQRYFDTEKAMGGPYWERIGYPRAALGLAQGFFTGDDAKAAVAALKRHLLRCFPNDPGAPRLSDPGASNPRLMTPYFAHFAFPALIAHGELGFVLEQYRRCWGWALTIESGTWLEVFDPRWSHCHQWSGCPTWQLSRALLGLQPRFDRGERQFQLALTPGPLPRASGRLPLPGTEQTITIAWQRQGATIDYRLTTPQPITLLLPDGTTKPVERTATLRL